MANVIEYKCPNCGGSLSFDIATQAIVCPYCEGKFSLDEVKAFNEASKVEQEVDVDFEKDRLNYSNDELNNLSSYYCDMCGANIVCDSTTSATFCPYCESPVILKGRLEGERKPDYVIPFKKDKEECKILLQNFSKKRLFLPGAFKQRNQIENFKGMYVPFWLFNFDVDAHYTFSGEIEKRRREGDYEVIKTDYYRIFRDGELAFDYIPVDGSSKIDNILMESIEPFDFNKAVKFDFAYLSGHFAERYDVGKDDCAKRAFERTSVSTTQILKSTISNKYDSVNVETSKINYKKIKVSYALYPVWFINTKYKDKNYNFIINGENGKMAGNLPLSFGRYFGFLAGFAIGICAILTLIFKLCSPDANIFTLIFASLVIGLIVGIVFCEVNRRKLKNIKWEKGSSNYYRRDSLMLSRSNDVFLHSSTRRRRVNNSNNRR